MNNALTHPLRCVHYLDSVSLASGGVVRAVLDLCGALARHGHTVTLVTWDDRDVPNDWRDQRQGVPTILRIERPRAGFLLSKAARQSVESLLEQTDVLHLHTPWDPGNIWFARAARRRGVPYVVTVHGMLDDWSMAQRSTKKRLYLALAGRRMLEGASAVHCTAEAEERQARGWIPKGRFVVLPCLLDLAPFHQSADRDISRQKFGLPADDVPVVLFLSRLHPKKGIEHLIDAAGLAKQEGRQLRVVVAGTGEADYEQSLRRQVADADLEGTIQFVGLVVGELKYSLYQAADLFVLPTHQENFGLVLIEAMASGTPVVTTRGVDIWMEIESAGGVIVAGNSQSIWDAIRSIVNQPDHGRQLGHQGREWVMTHFNEAQSVGCYQSLYASIADGDRETIPSSHDNQGREIATEK